MLFKVLKVISYIVIILFSLLALLNEGAWYGRVILLLFTLPAILFLVWRYKEENNKNEKKIDIRLNKKLLIPVGVLLVCFVFLVFNNSGLKKAKKDLNFDQSIAEHLDKLIEQYPENTPKDEFEELKDKIKNYFNGESNKVRTKLEKELEDKYDIYIDLVQAYKPQYYIDLPSDISEEMLEFNKNLFIKAQDTIKADIDKVFPLVMEESTVTIEVKKHDIKSAEEKLEQLRKASQKLKVHIYDQYINSTEIKLKMAQEVVLKEERIKRNEVNKQKDERKKKEEEERKKREEEKKNQQESRPEYEKIVLDDDTDQYKIWLNKGEEIYLKGSSDGYLDIRLSDGASDMDSYFHDTPGSFETWLGDGKIRAYVDSYYFLTVKYNHYNGYEINWTIH